MKTTLAPLRSGFAALSAVIAVLACQPLRSASVEEDRAVDRKQLAALLEHWEDAWNSHDMHALAALFHEDAVWVLWTGEVWAGRKRFEDGMLAVHKTVYANSSQRERLEELTFVGPDAAVMRFHSELTGDTRYPGKVVQSRKILVVTRRDGLWRIGWGQNTRFTERPQSQADGTEVAFVANAEAGTVALVDVASHSIIGVLDINPARTERKGPGATNYAQDADVSPDGRTIYVSRGYLGDVAAFDLSNRKMLWQRSLNTGRADHMTITSDGRSLFVSALMDNRVYKLSAATGAIDGHVVTGVCPHDVKVSKDGQRLYNSSLGPLGSLPRSAGAAPLTEQPGEPFQLTIADVETLAIRDRIKLDNAFRPWHFSPDEKLIYAQLSNEHAVVTYDLASRKVIRRLDLPVKPGVTSADWDFEAPHHGLALTDDGETLCLAARASDYAALVNAKDLTLIATIPTGDAPGWAEVTEEGRTCLIANTRSDELSIISIPKRVEVARLPIGNGPKHITVARIPTAVIAAFKTGGTR